MTPERLQELMDSFSERRIAVLGDFFLDKYLEVDPNLAEPSLETGRTAHQVIQRRRSPGAAGTVVNNLAALGATEIHALGAIGDDGEAFDLCKGLEQLGCSTSGLLRCPELMTPTYLKPRDFGVQGLVGEHSRYDTKNRQPTPSTIVSRLAAALGHILPTVDAIIVMDQVEMPDCGVVTAAMREILSEQAVRFPKVLFWADSRRHVRQFRHIVTKPNQFEAVGRANPLPGDEIIKSDLWAVIPRLRAETQAPVFVTWGEKGMVISDPEPQLIPGVQVKGPFDPTGAGDSATAGAVLTLVSGGSQAESALMGNLVASVTVRKLGTTGTASPAEVQASLTLWREQHPGLTIEVGQLSR
ncbi:MAG: PfkB family carbohydrate kinase [Planctomycetaceae bacterium]|nr:PfkB family carbohydrate kinase [Planctomycetaceae bacterium]